MNIYLGPLANDWLSILWRASIDGTVAILLVTVVALVLARLKAPAWVEHWLWKLVFVKLLLALIIVQPIALPLLAPPVATSLSVADQSFVNDTAFPAAMTPGITPAVNVTPTASVATKPTRWVPSWQVSLAVLWLLGAIIHAGLLLRQLITTLRLSMKPLTNSPLLAACRELAEVQGLRRVPRLAICDQISSPALVGWFRPTIAFPPETLEKCNKQQLRAVLAHELAHYRRADLWWNLIPALAQVFFYFHPMLWLANRRWRFSGEMACDAAAIEHSAHSVSEYADSLLRIALLGSQRLQSERCLGCVSVFDSSRSLKQRMFAMRDYRTRSTRQIIVYASGIALIGLLGTIPWQVVSRAAEPKPAKEQLADTGDASFGKNMDFEEKADQGKQAKHWGGGGEGYQLKLDKNDPHSGTRCAHISGDSDAGFGTYTQCIDADDLRDKRIMLSGYLKGDLEGSGGLWMRVDANKQPVAFDNMGDRRVKGKTAWTKQQVVLDVPETATKICFGFLLTGAGDLWADDLKIEIVGNQGEGPKTTSKPPRGFVLPSTYANLNFEEEPDSKFQAAKAWGGGGNGYELLRDATTKHSGSASGRIRKSDDGGEFGTFTQMFTPETLRGKRVRYSGFLKTKDADHAGLWMRVDGPDDEILAFDNMDPRPVKGTTDWKEYSIVLDVPKKAKAIAFGFLNSGSGTVWGDDLKIEAVGPVGEGPEPTDLKIGEQMRRPSDFVNGDFEKAGHVPEIVDKWGGGGAVYKLVRDTSEKQAGTACGRISKRKDGAGRFGTFTQMFPAGKYKGKRVRLSGYLKTKEAETAGLWMRIDGPGNSPLGFDNMSKRAVKGTTDWNKYSVVLDVPETATHIALGFLLIGDGTAWGDELELEIVGDEGEGPETTNSL